jgi:hypothetical protein
MLRLHGYENYMLLQRLFDVVRAYQAYQLHMGNEIRLLAERKLFI